MGTKGEARIYSYKGWEIKGYGGFITTRRFWAKTGVGEDYKAFWDYKLKNVKALIDIIELGVPIELVIRPYQLEPLYV